MGSVLLIGCIVMCAVMIEGIIGFGAAVFALPFLTMLIPVRTAVPLMSSFSLLLGGYVVITHRKCIDVNALKTIFLVGGIAFLAGMAVSNYLSEQFLKIILGIFVTAFALKSLKKHIRPNGKAGPATPLRDLAEKTALAAGGAFHGAFACGGPLMVIYASRRIKEKTEFRATMAVVWVVFGAILLFKNTLLAGEAKLGFWKTWAQALPFFLAGCAAGNALHKIVNVKTFMLLTDLLLLGAGLSTLIIQIAAL